MTPPRHDLFTLTGAVESDPAIDTWFVAHADDLGALARRWFNVARECGDDVRELLHDECPVVCVRDEPFAYVNVFKAHVNVGFFQGAALPDPQRLLEGTGKRMRHVKLRPGAPPSPAALEALIAAAYRDIRLRVHP